MRVKIFRGCWRVAVLLLILCCHAVVPGTPSYSFFDDLRRDKNISIGNDDSAIIISSRPLVEPSDPNHLGRNLHGIRLQHKKKGDGNDDDGTNDLVGEVEVEEEDMILCHIPSIFRWTNSATDPNDYVDVSNWAYGGSAAILMAMNDFNNGDGSLVKEFTDIHKTCPIRFTTEFINSESSAIVAVRAFTKLLIRDPKSLDKPQPCAIIGSSWSSVTKKVATITGVNDLLQVTPSASSVSLDTISEYPLFARTHPSDSAMARLGVQYFAEELRLTYFGFLYVDNEFGNSYKKDVLDTAALYGMTLESASFRPDATEEEIREALQQLKDTEFRYIMAVLFDTQYQSTMELAGEMGLAGPGQFWLFSGTLAASLVDGTTSLPKGSFASKATYGNAIVHDEGGLPGIPSYDNFLNRWRQLGRDPDILSYINSRQPAPPTGTNLTFERTLEYFETKPSHIATFSYDAVAGMALSACHALENAKSQNQIFYELFSGADHHQQFLREQYTGASGDVVIGPDDYSRSASSTYFVISNILPIEQTKNETTFQGKYRVYYDTAAQRWTKYRLNVSSTAIGETFLYPDGSQNPPKEIPDQVENKNLVQPAYRIVCLILAGLGMFLSILFAGLTITLRKHFVFSSSQPAFLVTICCGTFIMSSMIIPLSFDDSIVSSKRGNDIACMSKNWLFSVGFVITFSALFSKLWRLNKLLSAAQAFRRIQIRAKDVLIPFVVLLFCNVAILSSWTIIAPEVWERQVISRDRYGRPTESVGKCRSANWAPFGGSLSGVNGLALILCLWEAYRSRKTELSESKYIAIAAVCMFQAAAIGIPLIVLIDEDPTSNLFLVSGLVTVISVAILLLIFVPKIFVLKNPPSPVARNGTTGKSHISGLEAGDISEQFNGTSTSNVRQKKHDLKDRLRSSAIETASGIETN